MHNETCNSVQLFCTNKISLKKEEERAKDHRMREKGDDARGTGKEGEEVGKY